MYLSPREEKKVPAPSDDIDEMPTSPSLDEKREACYSIARSNN
jgi:hypothetical protein